MIRPQLQIVLSIVYGLAIPVGAFFAMFGVMLFDAPGSENNPWLQLMFWSLVSLPVLALISIAAMWGTWFLTRGWPQEKQGVGRIIRVGAALLPGLGVISLIAGIALLQVNCGGSFSC